jgi:hypothetical protein
MGVVYIPDTHPVPVAVHALIAEHIKLKVDLEQPKQQFAGYRKREREWNYNISKRSRGSGDRMENVV